jgi:hypothetical protein
MASKKNKPAFTRREEESAVGAIVDGDLSSLVANIDVAVLQQEYSENNDLDNETGQGSEATNLQCNHR